MSDTEIYRKSTREKYFPDLYLKSEGRRIDFVIIYSKQDLMQSPKDRDKLLYYLDALQEKGVQVEHTYHSKDADLGCIKIHVPHQILVAYADANDIPLAFKSPIVPLLVKQSSSSCRRTPLSYDDTESQYYHRARQTLGRKRPRLMIEAERILVAYVILQETPFEARKHRIGIELLKYNGIILNAFPLHEGPPKLTPEGPLTDRQLLAAFWGDTRNFCKETPIDIIQKYFGPEMGFYFIFVNLFNKMVAVAAIASIIFAILGNVIEFRDLSEIRNAVCQSKEEVCPLCDPTVCPFEPMKNYCKSYQRSTFDNVFTFALGVFISLWGLVFFEIWKRKRNLYRIKWNVTNLDTDMTIRPEYASQADRWVTSPVSGQEEPAMSKMSLTWRYIVVSILMFIMLAIVIILVLVANGVRSAVEKNLHRQKKSNIHTTVYVCGAAVQVFFIIIVDKLKKPAARLMTNLQNCRTQYEYDDSYIMKSWIISFVNGFSAIIYAAYMRGIFYTYPGDPTLYGTFFSYRRDMCGPGDCTEEILPLLIFIMVTETVLMKMLAKLIGASWGYIQLKRKLGAFRTIVQWENDYLYARMAERAILEHVAEMVHRLTMILFCTSILPIAPLIIFICNHMDIRVDAFVYNNLRRRPIPRKVSGLGVWYAIVRFLVMIAVLVNALTAVITKQFVRIETHYFRYGHLKTYMTNKFSRFRPEAYNVTKEFAQQLKSHPECLYHKMYRFPTRHYYKHNMEINAFYLYAYAAGTVIVYQHFVFFVHVIISKLMPNVAADVKEYMSFQQTKEKRILRKHRNVQHIGKQSPGSTNVRRATIGGENM